MELTIANVWPGAVVGVGDRQFRIEAVDTPRVWVTSPRGIRLVARVCARRDVDGVELPEPGRFERTVHRGHAYRVGRGSLWGYAYSTPESAQLELALWTAPREQAPRDMPQTHAINEVKSIVAAGGDRETAAFQAALRFGVACNWDVRPYPPFTKYVVGSGWSYLPGYWQHQADLSRDAR